METWEGNLPSAAGASRRAKTVLTKAMGIDTGVRAHGAWIESCSRRSKSWKMEARHDMTPLPHDQ